MLRVTGLCEGNSPVTGDFPAQKANNTYISRAGVLHAKHEPTIQV